MTQEPIRTIQDLQDAYEEIAPDVADRKVIFNQLLKSIEHCEDTGSKAWSVSLLDTGFRLNIGQVEALTCTYALMDAETLGLPEDKGFFDLKLLVSGADVLPLIESRHGKSSIDPKGHKSVGVPHWCVTASLPIGTDASDADRLIALDELAVFQSAHRHYVQAAAHTPTGKLRTASNFARFHSEALMAYARNEVARPNIVVPFGQFIANSELSIDHLPAPNAGWQAIMWFALTIDGYSVPGHERVKHLREIVEPPAHESLTALRTSLFHYQRAWRWGYDVVDPTGDELDSIHRVVEEIRQRVIDRELA